MSGQFNSLPVVAAVAALGMVVTGTVIWDAFGASGSLDTIGIAASTVQNQVAFSLSESRRSFLKALATADAGEQASLIHDARVAHEAVAASMQQLAQLNLPAYALGGTVEFQEKWTDYREGQERASALLLQGRTAEATALASEFNTVAFDKATDALQSIRNHLGEFAQSEAEALQANLRKIVLELALFGVAAGWLTWNLLAVFRSKRDQQLRHEREKSGELARSADAAARRSRVLELIGRNESLEQILEALCGLLQEQIPESATAVSIFHGHQLKEIVGPSLPRGFVESHYRITDSCELGASWAAMRSGEAVYTRIEGEPIWDGLREAALSHGFQSCWSHPVTSSNGQTVATIEVYFRRRRKPEKHEIEDLRNAARTAAIAIDHRQLYENLSFQAQRDPLTELPNRRLFQERLEQALVRATRDGSKVAVLMLDLDRFKQVNDLLGHRAGDSVIRTVAQRISHGRHPADTIARVGGDEFTVLLCNLVDIESALREARALLGELAQPVYIAEQQTHITASIGISLYPGDGEDATTLIRNADLALYQVKSGGGNNCQLYSSQMGAVMLRKMNMAKSLVQARQNHEFHLLYQPKTDTNLSLVGLEALIRWVNPDVGAVSPADFVPIAEETGLIVPIGGWALLEACCQSMIWQRAGRVPGKMAVNVSARQLADPGFVDFVRHTLSESGLRPEMLELELTETALMDYMDDSLPRLRRLRDLGITLAIDDFGTGYSSLSYLQKLPVSSVKIDQSFVREIRDDSTSTIPVIQAIVDLAHGMGLKVVAEGVETELQLHTLRVLGCDSLQGYLIRRPGRPSEIEEILATTTNSLLRLDDQIRGRELEHPVASPTPILIR